MDILARLEYLPKNGTASQSSTYQRGYAPLAADENYEQQLTRGNEQVCTHTLRDLSGWWEFRFNFEVAIESVEIYNRLDCCQGKINNALVEVYDEDASEGKTCGQVDSSTDAVRWVVCNPPMLRGRVVRITSNLDYVNICEVNFYGTQI